jgi:peptidoglycan hydrolase-like protein with peptidoglycan-binding domain
MRKNISLFASFLFFFLWGCTWIAKEDKSRGEELKKSASQQQPEPSSTPTASASETKSVSAESYKEPTRVPKEPTLAQIRKAQERLKAAGFNPGSIDGLLGAKTKAAVRKYQVSKGVEGTGALDEKTLRSLGVE